MLNSKDFPRINEALDSVFPLRGLFLCEGLQMRLTRFLFYSHESMENLPEHGHPFFEWIVPLRGRIEYSVAQQKLCALSDGGCVLFSPGIQHQRPSLRDEAQIAILQFSLVSNSQNGNNIIQKINQSLTENKYQFSHSWGKDLIGIYQCANQQHPLWRMLLHNRTEHLLLSLLSDEFGECFTNTETLSPRNSAEKWIARIEKIVESTLDIRLSSVQYSREIGLSIRQINRIIRQKHQMSFFRYLQKRRINAAKELLRIPFQSVKMTANTVGFSDVSLFCRQFRIETGMTPLEYAKQQATSLDKKTSLT